MSGVALENNVHKFKQTRSVTFFVFYFTVNALCAKYFMKRSIYILLIFLTLFTGCSVDSGYNKDNSPSSVSTILNETFSLFDYNVSSLDFALKIDSLIFSTPENKDSIALKCFGVNATLRKNGNVWYVIDGQKVVVVTTDGHSIRQQGSKWSVNIGSEISLTVKSVVENTSKDRWKVTYMSVAGEDNEGAVLFIKLKGEAKEGMKNMYVYQVEGGSSYSNTTILMRTYKVNYKITKPFIFEDSVISSGEIEQSVSMSANPLEVNETSATMIRGDRFLLKYKSEEQIFQREIDHL